MATLPATAEDSLGPYYPQSFLESDRADLVSMRGMIVHARGQAIVLEGTVLDVDGQPVTPVLVEFWQADADGKFRTPATVADGSLDPWFQGWSRQVCDDGSFRLRTVLPGPVAPQAPDEQLRAPHITVSIFCDGINRVATQLFFDGQDLNETDPLLQSLPPELRGRLVARHDGTVDGEAQYRLDIVMRGEGETPFFDDLES